MRVCRSVSGGWIPQCCRACSLRLAQGCVYSGNRRKSSPGCTVVVLQRSRASIASLNRSSASKVSCFNVDSAQRVGVGYRSRSTAKRAACIWPSFACLLKRGTSGPDSIVVVLHELLSRHAALQVEESWSILTDPGA